MSNHLLIPQGTSIEELKRILNSQVPLRQANFGPGGAATAVQLLPPSPPQIGLPLPPGTRSLPEGFPGAKPIVPSAREVLGDSPIQDLLSSLNLPLFRKKKEEKEVALPPPEDTTEQDQIAALIAQLTKRQALPSRPDFSEIRSALDATAPVREEQAPLIESILLGLAAGDKSSLGSLLLSAGVSTLTSKQKGREISKKFSKEQTAQRLAKARLESTITQAEFQDRLALSRAQQQNQTRQASIALAKFQSRRDTDLVFDTLVKSVSPAELNTVLQSDPALLESVSGLGSLGLSSKTTSEVMKNQIISTFEKSQPAVFSKVMQKVQQDFLLKALTGG